MASSRGLRCPVSDLDRTPLGVIVRWLFKRCTGRERDGDPSSESDSSSSSVSDDEESLRSRAGFGVSAALIGVARPFGVSKRGDGEGDGEAKARIAELTGDEDKFVELLRACARNAPTEIL